MPNKIIIDDILDDMLESISFIKINAYIKLGNNKQLPSFYMSNKRKKEKTNINKYDIIKT